MTKAPNTSYNKKLDLFREKKIDLHYDKLFSATEVCEAHEVPNEEKSLSKENVILPLIQC